MYVDDIWLDQWEYLLAVKLALKMTVSSEWILQTLSLQSAPWRCKEATSAFPAVEEHRENGLPKTTFARAMSTKIVKIAFIVIVMIEANSTRHFYSQSRLQLASRFHFFNMKSK